MPKPTRKREGVDLGYSTNPRSTNRVARVFLEEMGDRLGMRRRWRLYSENLGLFDGGPPPGAISGGGQWWSRAGEWCVRGGRWRRRFPEIGRAHV